MFQLVSKFEYGRKLVIVEGTQNELLNYVMPKRVRQMDNHPACLALTGYDGNEYMIEPEGYLN